MGTWGTGAFENDTALDWVHDLTESKDGWATVWEALVRVADAPPSETPEGPDCDMALAAAECVALVRGKPCLKPNSDVVEWCRSHPVKNAPQLAALAVRAVRRIRTASELKDLWEDSGAEEWNGVVGDLEKRLL